MFKVSHDDVHTIIITLEIRKARDAKHHKLFKGLSWGRLRKDQILKKHFIYNSCSKFKTSPFLLSLGSLCQIRFKDMLNREMLNRYLYFFILFCCSVELTLVLAANLIVPWIKIIKRLNNNKPYSIYSIIIIMTRKNLNPVLVFLRGSLIFLMKYDD